MAKPSAAAIGHAFGLAPKEAVEHLQSKGLAATDNWWEVWQEAQDRVFVVSKMTRLRLLSQTRQIVADMLDDGHTLEVAAKELETAYRKAGWWGSQALTDAEGGTEIVQLGSMRRIRAILRTNMHTAYAAGRWQRQQEVAASRPYWEYIAVIDPSTRDRHRKLHGLVMPADDPAWEAIYPPNGFNCRCRVRAITEREVKRRGLKVAGSAEVGDVVDVVGVDRRTGERVERPGKKIVWKDAAGDTKEFRPDPGWSYNPGRSSPASPTAPPPARAVDGQDTWESLGLASAADMPRSPAPPRLPAAKTQHEAFKALEEALGVDIDNPSRRVRTPIGPAVIRHEHLPHIIAKVGDRRERFANRIVPTLEAPDEVWNTRYRTAHGKVEYRLRYLKLFRETRARHGLAVATETPDGHVLWNYLPLGRNRDVNRQRVGQRVYPDEG